MNFRLEYRLSGVAIAVSLPLLFSISGCRQSTPADDADKPVVSVQAEHPTVGPITEDIISDAILSPLAQAAIQSKVTAPIKMFYVQRGSKVKAGQLLATLENQDLAAAALDNKGTYTAAQGAYTSATKQQVPQEETQAELDVQQAKATLDLDQSILNARSQLLAQGAIPGRDVDTAKATVLQAQANYQIAKQKLEAIKSVGKVASLQTAEGQLSSAKGKYLGAEAQLGYTSIRTPIAGVVTERPLFAGETAAAGTAVITVMDTSVLIAKLHLAQRQTQQLAIGGEATLLVPGLDEPVKAKVSLISPALDPGSTTVEIWLRVDNRDGLLKPGSVVHATIKGHTLPKAILIPTEAVQRSGESGGKIVMVIAADGTAHKKNITVGVATADTVQVTEGLSVSDTVITTGGYGLDDGTKVKVEAATAKPDAGEKE
jgi:HlyD family secretion protein